MHLGSSPPQVFGHGFLLHRAAMERQFPQQAFEYLAQRHVFHLCTTDFLHPDLGRPIVFGDPHAMVHAHRHRQHLTYQRERHAPLDAVTFEFVLVGAVLLQHGPHAAHAQPCRAAVGLGVGVEGPLDVQLQVFDAFLCCPLFDRGWALQRFGTQRLDECRANHTLEQRAYLHQPEDIGQRGVGLEGDGLEPELVRATRDVSLLGPRPEVIRFRAECAQDEFGAGAQDQVLHDSGILPERPRSERLQCAGPPQRQIAQRTSALMRTHSAAFDSVVMAIDLSPARC